MITTADEYLLKVYCVELKYGPKVHTYIDRLRLGLKCTKTKLMLLDVHYGLSILRKYDTRDIALDEAKYNTFTLEEMENLIETLNTKLQ